MDRTHATDPLRLVSAPCPSASRPPVSRPSVPCTRGRGGRLALPPEVIASLGYDAVGIPREHGERIKRSLPRVGCVFADDLRWWWIVPSGSDIGVTWPPSTSYAVDARLGFGDPASADPSWSGPRNGQPLLIHRPDGDSPYTPPIPLYFLACRLAGSTPHWSPDTPGRSSSG
ncbi:hypothetical protein [Streptomyces nodosus]|uniref:Uncharacterized protein n=1 Tax=Streptomyces nodosus TaxID=40318 RepID=A0A0B5DSP6_9ACTN|nr:hypothetical protein [Streptomyces nodosus]AJE43097.1 hypothetical protein SNOD_25980 [Streptomyces nodosus]MBB4794487.1 hypothetical protein [Streptomyces nodosus]QEV41598.1 hypothetical protein CP978_26290 [Streptomyces nodosus]